MDFNADDLETCYNTTAPSLYSYEDQNASTVPLLFNEASNPGARSEALAKWQSSMHPDPMIQDSHGSKEVSGPLEQSALEPVSWSMQPNEADWERCKPEIEQLYKDNTLTKVMAIMKREHRFPISTKMYKDRIGEWGLNKNIKSKKMEAIVCKQVQRSRVGKKSAFCLKNHPVSEQKIHRYRTRSKLLSDEQALTLRAKTPPDLVCYTPLASPVTTPRELETPELIVKLIQEYISGSFDSKVWVIGDDQDCTSTKASTNTIIKFCDLSVTAFAYLRQGEAKKAYQLLDIAVALTRQLLLEEAPLFLSTFITVIAASIDDPQPILNNVAPILLKHFYQMSYTIMGTQHPFSRIFSRLMRLENSTLEHVFSVARQCQLEEFATRLGRFSWTMMAIIIRDINYQPLKKNLSQSLEQCSALLAEFEHALGPSDPRCLRMRSELAFDYYVDDRYGEAVEIAQSIVAADPTAQTDLYRAEAFYALSLAEFKTSQFEVAEQNLRQAIVIIAEHDGWEDERVLRYMSLLTCWLEIWDKHDEATEIDQYVQILIDSRHERLIQKEEEEYQRCLASTRNQSS